MQVAAEGVVASSVEARDAMEDVLVRVGVRVRVGRSGNGENTRPEHSSCSSQTVCVVCVYSSGSLGPKSPIAPNSCHRAPNYASTGASRLGHPRVSYIGHPL